MKHSDFFQNEISKIASPVLRDFTKRFFDERVGAWFWESGASSSGKFHPVFSQGVGGLVRHVKAAFLFVEEFLRLNRWSYMREEYKDYARVAILLHDCAKYGAGDEMDKEAYAEHGALAAQMVIAFWEEEFEYEHGKLSDLLPMAIRSHMGQWVNEREDRPFTSIDQLVHYADYIASRNFIDIPQVSKEYQAQTEIDNIFIPF